MAAALGNGQERGSLQPLRLGRRPGRPPPHAEALRRAGHALEPRTGLPALSSAGGAGRDRACRARVGEPGSGGTAPAEASPASQPPVLIRVCDAWPVAHRKSAEQGSKGPRADLREALERRAQTEDAARPEAVERRHAAGARTARENLADLVDAGSFVEYGRARDRGPAGAPRAQRAARAHARPTA